MNSDRVQRSLQALFDDDRRWPHGGRRLVFWYDAGADFADVVGDLELAPARVLIQGHTPFALKRTLLLELPDTNALVYAPFAQPPDADNWLLDLQCTGAAFSADRAALIFTDLGFLHRPLEAFIRAHLKFFESKKRLSDLQALSLPADADQRTLATGMLAVLTGVRVADGPLIVRRTLSAGLIEAENPLWKDLGRFGAEPLFWDLAQSASGYGLTAGAVGTTSGGPVPTLRRLFITLLVAHLQRNLKGKMPEHLAAHVLPNGTRAYALLDAWLRDRADAPQLEALTLGIQGDLGIEDWAAGRPPADYQDVNTFPALERAALRSLVQSLGTEGANLTGVLSVTQARQSLHSAQPYAAEYAAVTAATQLFTLRRGFEGGFKGGAAPDAAQALLDRYTTDLYQFDRLYRSFVVAADRAAGDLLVPLQAGVEHLYVHWYLDGLGEAWSDAFDEELPGRLPVTRRQWSFFEWQVRPLLERNDRDRVVVIISDALRYEVATELRERLTTDLRGETTLGSMFSALPSQTRWGMSALLPGKTLTWDAGAERVLRDGQATQGLTARAALLAGAGFASGVHRLDELLAMSAEQGRAALEGKRVVYLYHDAIDARGDKPASERDVLAACAEAVDELLRGVKRLANSHGFLYQRSPIGDADKLTPPPKRAGVSAERRSVVGQDLPEVPGTLRVNLERYQTMAQDEKNQQRSGGAAQPLTALFPRGSLRFRTSGGGAQYVHGGASLQELVVPVLTYRHKRAGAGVEDASRKVGVQVVARSRKVTNTLFVVQLVQVEAVAERVRARTVEVRLIDPVSAKAVTTVRQATFASLSPHASDREQAVQLTVTAAQTDPAVAYLLTVTDVDDGVELIREPWQISIAFHDDFGDF